MTVYAHWKSGAYTITYNVGDHGYFEKTPVSSYTSATETFTLPTPKANYSYVFTGWTGSNGSTPQKTVTITKGSSGDKSYTANYRQAFKIYTLTFNANGGKLDTSNGSFELYRSVDWKGENGMEYPWYIRPDH